MQKKYAKQLFVSQIKVCEIVPVKCLYLEGNIYHPQSMFSQTVFRFCICVRETFSNSIAFSVINKYDKEAIV